MGFDGSLLGGWLSLVAKTLYFVTYRRLKKSICLQKCEEIHYFLNKKLFGIELKDMGLFPHFKDSGARITL